MPRSAFPSFVQTTIPPVAAMAKFAPVSAASAIRNRGKHDVTRRFATQLYDALTEVRVDDVDTARLQVRIEAALFREHRLALHESPGVGRDENPVHDGVVLGRIRRPMHLHPAFDRVSLELREVLVQMRERVFLDP
jgi:hypothetical protein